LAQQPRQPVATVLAGACVRQLSSSRVGQAQRVIQLAAGQQPGIRGDRRAAKLQQQTTVEIQPQTTIVRFTRRSPIDPPQAREFYLRTAAKALKIAASSGE
jgi:hypothetical protein